MNLIFNTSEDSRMQQQQQTTATTNAKPTPMLYTSQTVTNYTILLTIFNLPPILKQLGCFLSLYSFNFQDTSALLVPLYLQPGVGQYSSSQSLAEELLSLAGQLYKKSLCTSVKLGESSPWAATTAYYVFIDFQWWFMVREKFSERESIWSKQCLLRAEEIGKRTTAPRVCRHDLISSSLPRFPIPQPETWRPGGLVPQPIVTHTLNT